MSSLPIKYKWLSLLLLSSILTVLRPEPFKRSLVPSFLDVTDSHTWGRRLSSNSSLYFRHVHVTWRLSTFRCLKNENEICPLHNKLFSSEIHICSKSKEETHISSRNRATTLHYQTNICFHLRSSFHTTSQHTTHARVIHTAKEWPELHTLVYDRFSFA